MCGCYTYELRFKEFKGNYFSQCIVGEDKDMFFAHDIQEKVHNYLINKFLKANRNKFVITHLFL